MIIGITARREVDENNIVWHVNDRYTNFFVKNGHEIIFITPFNLSFLKYCDSLILTGGYDLNPKLYNEDLSYSNNIDDMIDELDFNVIKYAYINDIPLLGICRGLQSINVYFGGSLKQDIKKHMNVNHTISKVSDSFLLKFLPKEFQTNSFHHQSIAKLGKELKIVYESLDGEVEIIEHCYKKIYACQFHPEMNFKNEYFVEILNILVQR